jgi:hypothetical protein
MNPLDDDPRDPEVLPEEIVDWQPTHGGGLTRMASARPALPGGAAAIGMGTALAIAMGAFAIGAVAVGALAIGRMTVGRARFRELEIDHLIVRKLSVLRGGR